MRSTRPWRRSQPATRSGYRSTSWPGRCTSRRFHLAHRFRARTGLSLHAYRTHLRLREALRRIAEPETSLTDLALDLGFASHSHFTDSFRRTFGRPPSAVRAAVRARGSAEARRILEAVPAAGS